MTDGPFKNTNLSSRWKKYGEFLDNKTMSVADRVHQAQNALIEDLAPPAFKALVKDLEQQFGKYQGQLFPQFAIEKTIDKHSACEQAETLRKHIVANLQMKMDVIESFNAALLSTIEGGIVQADQRIKVHCIQVDEQRRSPSSLKLNHSEVFAGLTADYFRDAIFGSKQKVMSTIARIDDGPPLP